MEDLKTKLPILRDNLQLVESSVAQNGEKNWLLFDPLQNKYFTIGEDAFKLLSIWKNSCPLDEFIEDIKKNDYDIDIESLEVFISFLINSRLVKIDTFDATKKICEETKKQKPSFFKWLLKNYLFIRIPLFKPNRWLEDNLFLISFLYTNIWRNFVLIIGVIGIILTLRNWEEFVNTFIYLFSSEGILYYFISLIFIKSAHELGHAFTAKRYNISVPTMGVAFLVLFPVLYTDTTDSWRIKDKYKRLNIVLAGMKVELYLALLSTFIWNFLPEGIFKSIVFIIATTSWITSLLINISPFLRFDGYYALSDISDSKNLQTRSFAMAKWFLRKNVLGLDEVLPEYISKTKQNFFIIYAILTWIYRFFLFLGIAFLVYYFAFKVLGIFLFIVEILWFILIPIYKELKIWFEKRDKVRLNRRNISSLFIFFCIIIFFVIPWNNKISIPSVLEVKNIIEVYPPYKSQIKSINFVDGQHVKKGDILVELFSNENDYLLKKTNIEIQNIKKELKKIAASIDYLHNQLILEEKLLKLEEQKKSLIEKNKSLILKAQFDGIVFKNNIFNTEQWINTKESIFSLYNPSSMMITGLLNQRDLKHVSKGQKATFVFDMANMKSINTSITNVSSVSLPHLEFPLLSSDYGGDIAVQKDSRKQSKTEEAYYKVSAKFEDEDFNYSLKYKGVLIVEAESSSIISSIYTNILSILIRESGF